MNLIIDKGNSTTKIAIFSDAGMVEKWTVSDEDLFPKTASIIEAYPRIEKAIVAAVGYVQPGYKKYIAEQFQVLELSYTTKVPFTNLYETPITLGVDRIALVSAACKAYPGIPVLIIDVGSCITYDFKDRNEQYLGGAISPGLHMRYKAVNHFTAKLPLLDSKMPDDFIGPNTQESIHIGITKGVVYEIRGFIAQYAEKFPGLTTILTGGDADFLRDSLKNDIFANSNFLLEGLNYILEYNKD